MAERRDRLRSKGLSLTNGLGKRYRHYPGKKAEFREHLISIRWLIAVFFSRPVSRSSYGRSAATATAALGARRGSSCGDELTPLKAVPI